MYPRARNTAYLFLISPIKERTANSYQHSTHNLNSTETRIKLPTSTTERVRTLIQASAQNTWTHTETLSVTRRGSFKQQDDTGLAEETTPLTMIDNDLLHPAET